jgi:hypothetical protein
MEIVLVYKRTNLISTIVVILLLGVLLLNSQRITHAPHMDDLTSGTFLDSLFAIGLTGLVLFISAGLGVWITKQFKMESWSFIEQTIIGIPLGLAAIGYSVLFMGLAGWINPIHFICLLIMLTILSFKKSVSFLYEALQNIKGFKNTWKKFTLIKKVVFSAGALALVFALFQGFTPPWDYDGLMYHLQGPRLFLEAGKIIPLPENVLTFYPFTWEMIYMMGLALGSDIFARLIHFSTLILFLLATYIYGRRFLSKLGGWIAVSILLGIPILLILGISAYTDIAWGLFQFLAIAIFLVWLNENNAKLLVLSGLMQGLALGSKYLAISGAVILFVYVFWFSRRIDGGQNNWKKSFQNGMLFGVITIALAMPWYLKNLIWTGNPVFPFYLPQDIVDINQLKIWMGWINSFGTGKNWFDYLLLPINLYIHNEEFGSFLYTIDMPNPLFLLVFLYIFTRKYIDYHQRETLDILSTLTGFQFVFWAFGSQQGRFLIPLYPSLSILVSSVLISSYMHFRNKFLWKKIITILVGGMVFVTLILMCIYMWIIQPEKVILGLDSKSDFLSRIVHDFRGVKYINSNLLEDDRVLLLWDGRSYYCNNKCSPDVDQSIWSTLIEKTTSLNEVAGWLNERKITHLFFSKEDISYFLTKHDPQGLHLNATKFLLDEFVPNCTVEIYKDDWVYIYKLLYHKDGCG